MRITKLPTTAKSVHKRITMKKNGSKFCAYISYRKESEIENFRLDISWKGKLIKEEKYQEQI